MNSHPHDRPAPELHDDDPVVRGWLETLDPGQGDAGYWMRFHRGVLARAGDELARRRAAAEPSVQELVSSWSRAIVPAALAAAAAAAFLLLQPSVNAPQAPASAGVEEFLTRGLEGGPAPALPFEDASGTGGPARFAAEIF